MPAFVRDPNYGFPPPTKPAISHSILRTPDKPKRRFQLLS